MESKQQRLSFALALTWAAALGMALATAAVVWWRKTNGAAPETSLAQWLVMLALCGTTGGYIKVLVDYVAGMRSGLNVSRWFFESMGVLILGAVAGTLAAALVCTVAGCFFEIRAVRWTGLCALAGVVGIAAWPLAKAKRMVT